MLSYHLAELLPVILMLFIKTANFAIWMCFVLLNHRIAIVADWNSTLILVEIPDLDGLTLTHTLPN